MNALTPQSLGFSEPYLPIETVVVTGLMMARIIAIDIMEISIVLTIDKMKYNVR